MTKPDNPDYKADNANTKGGDVASTSADANSTYYNPQNRPLSPHLQVYNMFAITSLTSILHRATGTALTVGSLIVVAWLLALSHGAEPYTRFTTLLRHPLGQLVLVGLSWAFWYHFLNGLRHLTWDTGRGLDIDIARLTGKIGLIASVIVTALMWLYIYKGL